MPVGSRRVRPRQGRRQAPQAASSQSPEEPVAGDHRGGAARARPGVDQGRRSNGSWIGGSNAPPCPEPAFVWGRRLLTAAGRAWGRKHISSGRACRASRRAQRCAGPGAYPENALSRRPPELWQKDAEALPAGVRTSSLRDPTPREANPNSSKARAPGQSLQGRIAD